MLYNQKVIYKKTKNIFDIVMVSLDLLQSRLYNAVWKTKHVMNFCFVLCIMSFHSSLCRFETRT